MHNILEAKVQTTRLKLSRSDAATYTRLDSYDWILFSSKNAAQYFAEDLKKYKIALSDAPRIAAVGDVTAKVLKRNGIHIDALSKRATLKDMVLSLGTISNMRILFPRSAVAAKDAIVAMRKKGATVRTIALYTTTPVPLTKNQRNNLLAGKYVALHFKSPSGVCGLLKQFSAPEKRRVLSLEAECIGPTTAAAAKNAGFRSVRDLSI